MKKNFLIVILLIIILALVSFSIYYISKEKNEEPELEELIVSDEPIEGVTKNINENIDLDTETVSYLIMKSNNEPTETSSKVVLMFCFDSSSKCIGLKAKFTFFDEETAQEQYKNWKEITTMKDLKINGKTVIFTEIDTPHYGETADYIQENSYVGEGYTVEKTSEKYNIEDL